MASGQPYSRANLLPYFEQACWYRYLTVRSDDITRDYLADVSDFGCPVLSGITLGTSTTMGTSLPAW